MSLMTKTAKRPRQYTRDHVLKLNNIKQQLNKMCETDQSIAEMAKISG